MQTTTLILASASPRRLELLRNLGLRPAISPPDIDETPRTHEPPARLASRLALDKCRQVAGGAGRLGDNVVLAADTLVVRDGQILGKPRDRDDAERMLNLLSGRTHQVLTGVALIRTGSGKQVLDLRSTDVRFRRLSERWIEWYLATGEADDKAGAYAVQGLGSLLVESIRGSWTNVVGLPLERLPSWLEALDLDLLDLVAGQPTSPE